MKKNVEKNVKVVLEDNAKTRNDDHVLYMAYLTKHSDYGFSYVFMHYKELGLPSFESVSRARRKIQEKTPELRATADTEAARLNEEIEYYNHYKE